VAGALRALSVCAPLACLEPPLALANAPNSPTLAAGIPAQSLARALASFADQSGLQLVYVSSAVSNRRSHAVSAGVGTDDALSKLLQGTGLQFEYLTPQTIRIYVASNTPERIAGVAAGDELVEVIVTANRREESLQDVPLTVQSISQEQLKELSVTSLSDLLRYTPNVTFSGNGPGTGDIFIRGLGFVGTGNQSQATVSPFPNVALFLNEQSMQFPSRNNDVYLVDMARVEVLEGPQGTLLGGSTEAGAIRYITNVPALEALLGETNAAYGTTTGGDQNTALNAMLNVPLGPSFALRAVIFSEHRGGYIDNVPSTISYVPGTAPHDFGGNPSADNAGLVANDTNPVTYQGYRLSALWQASQNWDLLLQLNQQNTEADGYFYAYPAAPDGESLQKYQIAAFTPAYNKDRYSSLAWTLDGKLGDLVKLVYTGSYMVRHIEAQQDYSNYLRNSTASTYYACIGTGPFYFNSISFPVLAGTPTYCGAPVGNWHDKVRNTHQSHELRVSTSDTYRLRGLFGAFWEKFVIYDDMTFNYLGIAQCNPVNLAAATAGGPGCLSAVGPVPGAFANNPALREDANTAFGQDLQRGYKQAALFASIDFDIVPKVLTVSAGTRYFRYDDFEDGSEYYSLTYANIVNHANGSCTAAGGCGFPITLSQKESGFSSRANLTWHITPDLMTYYTFAQGYRPGGFNRTYAVPGTQIPLRGHVAPYCAPPSQSVDPRCQPGGSLFNAFQAVRPAAYDADDLVSNELGFKSELLDHRLLLNASAYYMKLNRAQSMHYDPAHLGGLNWITNGPDYTIRGVELQLVARVTDGLTVQGSSAWNRTHQSNSPCLRSVGITPATPKNPTPAGECITVVSGQHYTSPWGASGTVSPYAPPLMYNVRARYDWNRLSLKPFVMLSASYIASMTNAPASFPDGPGPGVSVPTSTLVKYTIPAHTTYDAAIGLIKGNLTAQIACTNLSNSYAASNISAGQYITAQTPLRPRTLMAELSLKF
jgi:outer membrane receptor protein involved in Fe transport